MKNNIDPLVLEDIEKVAGDLLNQMIHHNLVNVEFGGEWVNLSRAKTRAYTERSRYAQEEQNENRS